MGLPPFIAHRFGRAHGPDSSRTALHEAMLAPVVGVETDCCLTADGKLVLLHDPLLRTSTNLAGWADERRSAEIRSAHIVTSSGEVSEDHPLLLEEALEVLAPSSLMVQLEPKASADEALARRTSLAICETLAARRVLDKDRVEIISFWHTAVEVAAAAGFRTRLIVAGAYAPEAFAAWAASNGVSGVILEGPYFATAPVSRWREAGLSVMSGVVNDAELLERVVEFHPDYVATDRPSDLAADWREL